MARVKATLTHGRNGGRAVAWIAGLPQGFTRQYVFPAGQPLDIDEADADALAAGTIDLGGRVIVVARGAGKPPAATVGAKDAKDHDAAGAALGAAVDRASKAFRGDGA